MKIHKLVVRYSTLTGMVIRAMRVENKKSQGEFGEALNLSGSIVSRIECGEVPVDLNRLKILANYFEKTPSALLQEVDALAVKLVARGIEVVEEMPRETGVFEMVPKNIARLVAELRRN